jgi:hypothetical protein
MKIEGLQYNVTNLNTNSDEARFPYILVKCDVPFVQESYVRPGRDQYGNEMDAEQGMLADDRIFNRERRMDDYGDQFYGRPRDRDRDRDRLDRERNGDRERSRRRRSEERSRLISALFV